VQVRLLGDPSACPTTHATRWPARSRRRALDDEAPPARRSDLAIDALLGLGGTRAAKALAETSPLNGLPCPCWRSTCRPGSMPTRGQPARRPGGRAATRSRCWR
jgi:hypothetical protein